MFLWNTGTYPPNYTASQHKNQNFQMTLRQSSRDFKYVWHLWTLCGRWEFSKNDIQHMIYWSTGNILYIHIKVSEAKCGAQGLYTYFHNITSCSVKWKLQVLNSFTVNKANPIHATLKRNNRFVNQLFLIPVIHNHWKTCDRLMS